MVRVTRAAVASSVHHHSPKAKHGQHKGHRQHGQGDEMTVQHDVFDWVYVPSGHENEWLSKEDVVQNHGVKEKCLYAYVKSEIKGEEDVKSLPWALLCMVLFALMMLHHEHIGVHNTVKSAFTFHIQENANWAFTSPGNMGHKDYRDVFRPPDFYAWMRKGFVPLTETSAISTSEDSAVSFNSSALGDGTTVLLEHQRIGPVKLEQAMVKEVECPNKNVADRYDISCTASSSIDLKLAPTEWEVTASEFAEHKSKSVWLNGNVSQSEMQLKDMEANRWIDNKTDRVRVALLTYSAQEDMLFLTHVNFFFAGSGHTWKQLTFRSLNLKPYDSVWPYIVDVLFYVQVTVLCVKEVSEICSLSFKHRNLRRVLRKYLSVWNVIDWAFIVVAYVFLAAWVLRVVELEDIQERVLQLPPEAAVCTTECGQYYSALFEQIEAAGQTIHSGQILSALCPLVILFRLFKAFSAQPRLAMVTTTLREASSDVSHYLIVFFAIFMSYAVMGVAFFGRELESFSTMDRAVPTIFLTLLGEYSYDDLEAIGRPFSFFFFFTFLGMLELVMLSMLIAIIMDVYVDVKAKALKSEPLWSEVQDMMRRGWQNWRGSRVPLPKIRDCLDKNGHSILRVSDLLQRVPGIKSSQALRVLEESVAKWANTNADGCDNNDVKEHTDGIQHTLRPFLDTADGPGLPSLDFPRGDAARVRRLAEEVDVLHLLRAAEVILQQGSEVPSFPGSAKHMSGLVHSAQTMWMDLMELVSI